MPLVMYDPNNVVGLFGQKNMNEIIDEKLTSVGAKATEWLGHALLGLSDKILAVIAIAAVGYIAYQAIRYMWFGKEDLIQKTLFGYFALLLIRVFSALIHIKIGG